jgi:AcrR family transcriptional regulator
VRDGFHAASIDDISIDADLSPSIVYRQFKTKAELFRAVIDDALDKFSASLRRWVSEAPNPTEVLARVSHLTSSASGNGHREARTLAIDAWAEAQRDPILRRRLRARYLDLVALNERLIRNWCASGEFETPTDLAATAQLLTALVPGGYVLGLLLGGTKLARAVPELLRRGRRRQLRSTHSRTALKK